MGNLGKLAGVVSVMGALAAPVEAQEDRAQVVLAAMDETNGQVTDCVGFVREQRDLARENNIVMSRADQRSLLHQCNNHQLEARIAEQELILASFDERIRQYDLRLNEQGQIIDENNQVIAHIIAINGQWVIQRQLETSIAANEAEAAASRVRQEQMLQEAERILQDLVG